MVGGEVRGSEGVHRDGGHFRGKSGSLQGGADGGGRRDGRGGAVRTRAEAASDVAEDTADVVAHGEDDDDDKDGNKGEEDGVLGHALGTLEGGKRPHDGKSSPGPGEGWGRLGADAGGHENPQGPAAWTGGCKKEPRGLDWRHEVR